MTPSCLLASLGHGSPLALRDRVHCNGTELFIKKRHDIITMHAKDLSKDPAYGLLYQVDVCVTYSAKTFSVGFSG